MSAHRLFGSAIYKGLDGRKCFQPGCSREEYGCLNLLTVQEVLEVGGAFFSRRGVLLKWNVVEGEGE